MEDKVKSVLTTFYNNKALDSDGLSYKFYKDIQKEVLLALTGLFNYCFETSIIFKSWSKSIITLISKKNKELK